MTRRIAVIFIVSARTTDRARNMAVKAGWDFYAIEEDWRMWASEDGRKSPENADGAFIGFVKKWIENRGNARC